MDTHCSVELVCLCITWICRYV